MEKRVELSKEKQQMPVPEKSDRDETQKNGDSKDSGGKKDTEEALPQLGRLSLNVKAVPYVPKQDCAAYFPKGGQDGRNHTGTTAEGLGNTTAETEKSKNQAGGEREKDLRAQVLTLQQNLKQYEDMIGQYQASEQTRKREVDSALISAREVVERERREKLDVMSDRKSKQEKYEQLTKALNMLQAENEELRKRVRQQDENVKEFTRLKTLIQENGFPNIEQFLLLQQQVDSFRDDFFTERKERERLQSQKDKLKRDLDAAQARIASLQEQVAKYREHIYFIQNKSKQSSLFRPLSYHGDTPGNRAITTSDACKLYGPNAPQYINQSLTPAMNPVSGAAEPKFSSRGDKRAFGGRYNDAGGRQWQDSRVPRPMPGGDDWRRSQQPANRNGSAYFNSNMHRLTTSTSAPSLAAVATGEQNAEMGFYEKPFQKPGFQRRSRSSLAEDTSKDFGMAQLTEWPKQPLNNKQGKRFPSPLASPNLLTSPTPEFWTPQQAPGLGFQKGWPSGQDEIFRFPSSPLTTPTSNTTFDTWPPPSASTTTEEQNVSSPPISAASDEGNLFAWAMVAAPTGTRQAENNNPGRFPQAQQASNGKVYVCYNCGINFDNSTIHSSHVETCGL